MSVVTKVGIAAECLQQLSDVELQKRYGRVFDNRTPDDPVRKAVVAEYERRQTTLGADTFQ